MQGDKLTKKRNNYNDEILNAIEIEFGYSIDYIRKSIRGDRTGIMPDKIVKRYKELEIASKKAIEKEIQKS